ncbi:O-methyltransferase [Candidatus Woesearchaeota archaeon]|nr:O-methyltransferase [Candidatus Woesearchaeota archaeon]
MEESTKRLRHELERFGERNAGLYNIPPETGAFLSMLVHISKAKNILEVGTSNGYSALWLAAGRGKVTTIEADPVKVKMAAENFRRSKLGNITLVQGNALREIPKLKGTFDFLFLDATKEEYFSYLNLAYPRLSKGAVIAADNAINFGKYMEDYLNYVRSSKKFKSVLVPIGNGVELTLKL